MRLLDHVHAQFERAGEQADHLDLRNLPADVLLGVWMSNPAVADVVAWVEVAGVVIPATPVYKAAYSGLLKTFLGLLSQNGLRDRVVLLTATGDSLAHTLATDYALHLTLMALAVRLVLPGIFTVDSQIVVTDNGMTVNPSLQQRLDDDMERVHQALALTRHPAVVQAIISSRIVVRVTLQIADEEQMRCLA